MKAGLRDAVHAKKLAAEQVQGTRSQVNATRKHNAFVRKLLCFSLPQCHPKNHGLLSNKTQPWFYT